MNYRLIALYLFLVTFFLAPQLTQAAGIPDPNSGGIPVTQYFFRTGSDNTGDVINTLWDRAFHIIFLLLGSIAVLQLIYAGIQYITANGAPDRIKKARQQIFNVILGIAVLVASYTIISLVLGLANAAARAA